MVEINNQTGRVPRYAGGLRELITDVRKPETLLWRHCRRRGHLLITPITPKLVTLNLQTQINRCRTLPASFLLVGCLPRKQFGLKDFSPESQTLWYCRLRGSVKCCDLWLIVVISVRQSTVAAISGLHCRALVMVSSSIRLTAHCKKSKEAGGTAERLMYEWVTAIISALPSASSSACHGLLIITVITPLPTKPSDKNAREPKLANAAIKPTCRCVSVMLLRSMQKYGWRS